MSAQTTLPVQADDLLAQMVEIRHDFHRNPELGYQENRTAERVRALLGEWGVAHRAGLAGGTGVLGFLPATEDDPSKTRTVALRADMDALPILEDSGVPYRSERSGVMHACGHDGHTAILLGTARALSRVARKNNVLLVFQPAEEGGAGGQRMCLDGVLDGTVFPHKADVIYGLHGYPAGELGHVYTRNGPLLAAASEFRITINGQGSHAAYPHLGVDPVVVAAHIVTALQTIASRSVDPVESVVVTVGQVIAGVAHNVIPENAVLKGTLRALNDQTNALGMLRIGRVAQSVAEAFGAAAEVEWMGAYPVTLNDPIATDRFRAVARETIGVERVHEEPNPSMGGEDFSFYGRQVPASFYFLGLKPAHMERYPGLHSPQFDFNDDAIPTGIALMSALAEGG